MDPSKPPSDIGASSKANSDIEERPKASSDIGVTTIGSKLSSSIDFAKPDGLKAELESKSGKCDREPRHRSGSVNVKLSSTEPGHPTPVEDAPVDSRLPRKRGKLVHSCGSIDNSLPSYSFVSTNSFEHVGDGTCSVKRRTSLFDPEKLKLQAKIEECSRAERRNSEFPENLDDSFFKYRSTRYKVSCSESENSARSQAKLQKSQSFACSNVVAPRARQWTKMRSLSGSQDICNQSSFKCQSRLVKMQTLVNLDNIETNIENIPECAVLDSGFNSKKVHANNYICPSEDKHQARALKHSSSFQVGCKLRETRIVNTFEKPKLLSSRSFSAGNRVSESGRQPRLGNVSTTKCYDGSISCSIDGDTVQFENSMIGNRRSNLSPPPLSNLQIFAISTKPLDIPVTTIDTVPSDVDKLPSLPIIQHSECRLESEKKLSILEPPPPGLVSREESTENWNRFLVQLNSILESRAGEFV